MGMLCGNKRRCLQRDKVRHIGSPKNTNLTDNSIQISELVQFIINPNSENNPETFSDINNKKTEENDRKLMFLLFQKYLHDSHTARSKHLLQIYKKMPGLSKMKPLEQEVTLKINLIKEIKKLQTTIR